MRNPQFLALSPVSIGGIEHHILCADPAFKEMNIGQRVSKDMEG
jgi:hypothetical protein